MKVDLRENMLDKKPIKKNSKKKKNDWKKIFSVLIGNGKVEKSEAVEQLTKKSNLLNKNYSSKTSFDEKSFPKIERIGIGQSDFQPKKENKKANEEIKKDEFTENSIQPDYQNNLELDYERSYYVENYPEKVLIKWQGPDYEAYPKSKKWYITMGLVLSAIVIYAVWQNSPLMAIVFVLIGIVGYLYLERDPIITDFAVTYDGVVVGREIYSFEDMDSFWIFYDPPHTRILSLDMKGRLVPYIHIPLHQVDPVEVREKLMKFIPEIKQEQGLVDVLERLLHL